jgi:hypothetical protein
MELLTDAEIEAALVDLPDWTRDGDSLTRTFRLNDFVHASLDAQRRRPHGQGYRAGATDRAPGVGGGGCAAAVGPPPDPVLEWPTRVPS